jgi:hypothetical protein
MFPRSIFLCVPALSRLRVFGGTPGRAAGSALVAVLTGGAMRNLQPMADAHVVSSTLRSAPESGEASLLGRSPLIFVFHAFFGRYPTTALLACFGAIWEAGHLRFEELKCPVLLVGSAMDQTINWRHTVAAVFPRLPGPKVLYSVQPNHSDHQHVLASHIQSPGYVAEVCAATEAFVKHHAAAAAGVPQDESREKSRS